MIAGDLHLEMTVRMVEKILAAAVLSDPIDHLVIDEFLPSALAEQLSSEFVSDDDPNWHAYKNSIEDKKTCNQWNLFPPQTYQYFCAVCSDVVSKAIASKFGIEAEADIGLHGGGQHIHARMGNLNPHLDYSIHPKSGKERRINAIYYLTDQHTEDDGGHFGLWDNQSEDEPGDLRWEYAPTFNRLILFNTSQNSWHGLSRRYEPIEGRFRKSLASYYVSEPRHEALTHTRALFAPRVDQREDEGVRELIKQRADEKTVAQAFWAGARMAPSADGSPRDGTKRYFP